MIVSDLRTLGVLHDGQRVGYTSGVFDLFHFGHVAYLEQCKKLCDVLVVGVDSDAMVKRNKSSNRPIEIESVRVRKVSEVVDYCFLKNEASINYVRLFGPGYHFFSSEKDLNEAHVASISEVEGYLRYYLIPYTKGISTTEIIRASNN